jgi:phosphoribosylformimino-5-aminoimidazole carboxamide ribotide isomerase
MRLIPVIDLLNGQAVHAVKGDRSKYLPVRSVLCGKPDPTMIARAFRDILRLNEIYVADLNAIQNTHHMGHRDLIASLARNERVDVILDAGISNVEEALTCFGLGIRKAIIGSETLRDFSCIRKFHDRIDPDRLVFSLDIRAGKVLSRCPELTAMSPVELLSLLQQAGWHEVILLDLDRVGSEEGLDRAFVLKMQTSFPDLNILVGGGMANPEQLVQLRSLGVAGVLLATALHRGIVTARHISELSSQQ